MASMFQQRIVGEKATSRIASYGKLQPAMLKTILAIKKDVQDYVKTGKVKQFRSKQLSPKVNFPVNFEGIKPQKSMRNNLEDSLQDLKSIIEPSPRK